MTAPVDLYHNTDRNFAEQVMAAVRQETYGQDLGQNGWITAEEYDGFGRWLGLAPGRHLLEVASGSGGPAPYLARKYGCRVTGLDLNESGVAAANQAALAGHTPSAYFQVVDADRGLPFEADTFDALLCYGLTQPLPLPAGDVPGMGAGAQARRSAGGHGSGGHHGAGLK